MNALISIHDVMPHTLDRVDRILDRLNTHGVPPVTLLVVPGLPWHSEQIDHLRELSTQGHELAAHGWRHDTKPRHIYHRLHAALISRHVAEHLDLNSQGILQLMQSSQKWFTENNLPTPDFYVPPAWALGPISKSDLAHAPYRIIEATTGLLIRESGSINQATQTEHDSPETRWSFQKLPLTGYEADTPIRELFLRRWNRMQAKRAENKKLPLRISIHPDDLDLRLYDQLSEQIDSASNFYSYKEYAEKLPKVPV